MLGGIRPSGLRRSWWLREALAAEAATAPHLAADRAAPPLRGTTTADVVILGGGYTGLWTALRLTELDPRARVVILEQDICGGGPSGRSMPRCGSRKSHSTRPSLKAMRTGTRRSRSEASLPSGISAHSRCARSKLGEVTMRLPRASSSASGQRRRCDHSSSACACSS